MQYAGLDGLPPLVEAAVELARTQRFNHSCAPEQGRLLQVLAGGYRGQRIGETGTGCGVGLAWMLDAVDGAAEFVSVEIDAERAAASAALYQDRPNVRILNGDWTALRAYGPFDLLVLDGGGKGKEAGDEPLDPCDGWVTVGGTVVLDDFIPSTHPNAALHDVGRRYWLEHPALRGIELRLTPDLATIVATRVR